MSDFLGANVHTVESLKDVRNALILFQERAQMAMGDVRQKVDRAVSWLELDRPAYWRDQEHRTYDLLASCRIAYETCRLRTVGGRKSDCIEEKKAFERAKLRMDYVREKQQAVKKWMVQAGREANEYRARTGSFQRALENEVPLMIAQLARMIDAIEAYSEVQTSSTSSSPSNVSANPFTMTSETKSEPATETESVDRSSSGPTTQADTPGDS